MSAPSSSERGSWARSPASATSHGGQYKFEPASMGAGGRGAAPRWASLAAAPLPQKARRSRAPASGTVRGARAPTSHPLDRARLRYLGPNPRRWPAASGGEHAGLSCARGLAARWPALSSQSGCVV
ncbi:hypothetical protein NDU88_003228 [Pleurodeles waltl]|uniref:Uncharacterized protein n=1 Tax=Pleurodeles waltl TaxID=8319 RepID=A0AAV7LHY4_PLEWA|nr:hypothetical protein NDU88_003228 [Pleurodeles waltl]